MINIYNSLTKQKEELVPFNSPNIRMYMCGPTEYDYFNIGNACSFIKSDIVRRYLNNIIFKPTEIFEYLSSIMTLEYEDIIFTGTTQGVSKVNKGEKIFASFADLIFMNCSVELYN
jgi:cysteinyl-tRNA synthetase